MLMRYALNAISLVDCSLFRLSFRRQCPDAALVTTTTTVDYPTILSQATTIVDVVDVVVSIIIDAAE